MTPALVYLLVALGGAALGVGGTVGVFRALGGGQDSEAPEAVAAVAPVVEAVVREDVTDAETRAAIASAPAVNLAVEAAVVPGASASTVALAAYALCIAGAQGKSEGSAAFGCVERGKTLDSTIAAPK